MWVSAKESVLVWIFTSDPGVDEPPLWPILAKSDEEEKK